MAQNVSNNVLFNRIEVEIDGVTYMPPRKFSAHQFPGRLDPNGNPTKTPGTYSLALLLLKHIKEGNATLVSSNAGVYVEWPGHKVVCDRDGQEYTIACNENRVLSNASEAIVLSAIATAELELMDRNKWPDDSPEFFCDAVYYGYAQKAQVTDTELDKKTWQKVYNDICGAGDAVAIVGNMPSVKAPAAKKPQTPGVDPIAEEYQKMLNGEYVIDYDWDPRVRPSIPPKKSCLKTIPSQPLLNLVNFVKEYAGDAAKLMAAGEDIPDDDFLNIQVPGPVGSGKTLAVQVTGEITEMPTYLLTATPEDYADELTQGVTKFEGGEPVHRASTIAKWMEFGGILLIDEMVMGRPDQYFSALAQVLENPRHIYDDGIREIKRHPLAICVMAYNNGIAGGKTISQPLMSRFDTLVEFNVQDESVFVSALMRYMENRDYPYKKEALARWLYDAFNATVEYLKKSKATDALAAISMRACHGMLKYIKIGRTPQEALICLSGIVAHYSPKHGEALKNDVFPSLRDIESY